MNLQQWSDNCCRATLKPFAIDRTTHRSKRNRRICCIWLWLWWVETLSSSFLIQSNLDERTWKRYVVYRIRFRIRFYKYPRSKGRAETTRLFPLVLSMYPCFHKNSRFQNFYSLPSISPFLPSILLFILVQFRDPFVPRISLPRGREFVRDSSKLAVQERLFVEIRGRYTIKFPEAKNTNRLAPTILWAPL